MPTATTPSITITTKNKGRREWLLMVIGFCILVLMLEGSWIIGVMSSCDAFVGWGKGSYIESRTDSITSKNDQSVGGVSKSEKRWQAIIEDPEIPARKFRQWNYTKNPFPCVPAEKRWNVTNVLRSPADEGLMFIRNMKTGSSTIGGISIRIAKAMAQRTNLTTEDPRKTTDEICKVRFDHSPARIMFRNRNRQKSYLFSFIRDPTKRAISQFFHFAVSRFKDEPTTENMIKFMTDKPFLNNYFLFDMALGRFNGTISDWEEKKRTAIGILRNYDFIGVTERMDESLVVLKHLLGLEFSDIMYMSAKGNGGFDDGAYGGKCYYIVPAYVPPGMKEFFASEEWARYTDGDNFLFRMASKSLDATIDGLGRDLIQRDVRTFQHLRQRAQEICLPETTFPCTADGVFHKNDHDCYWWDSGCGYKCLDRLNYDDMIEEINSMIGVA